MKATEIAEKYGFDKNDFEQFLFKTPQIVTSGFATTKIADDDVEKAVALYTQEVLIPREAEERIKQEKEKMAKEIAEEAAAQIAEELKKALNGK